MLKKRSSNKLRRSSSCYHKKCSRPLPMDDLRSRKPPLSNIPFKSWFHSSALIIMLQYMLIVCLLYGSSEFVQMIPSATATEPKARYDVRQYLHKGPHRPKEGRWNRQPSTSSIAPRKLQSVEGGGPGPYEASHLPHRGNQEDQSGGVSTFRVREVGHDVIGDDFIHTHPQEGYVQEGREKSLLDNDHLEEGLIGRMLSSSAPSNAPVLQGLSSGEPHPLEVTRLLLSQSNQLSLPTTAAAAAPAAKEVMPNSSTPNALSTTKYDTYSSNPSQSSDKLFIPLVNIGTGKTGCPTAGTNGCGQSSTSSPASALAVAATTPTTSIPADTNAGGAILPSSFGSSGMNIYSSNPVTVNNPITISQPNIQKSADFNKVGSLSPLQNILQEKKTLLSGMALGAGLASLHKGLLP